MGGCLRALWNISLTVPSPFTPAGSSLQIGRGPDKISEFCGLCFLPSLFLEAWGRGKFCVYASRIFTLQFVANDGTPVLIWLLLVEL